MGNIILTTPEELRAIVSEAVSGILPKTVSNQSQIDTVTLNDALELLKEYDISGYSVAFIENNETDCDSKYKFKLRIDIENIGFTVENTYKINFYINRENISKRESKISFSWDKHIDYKDYQLNKIDKKLKLSSQGKFSIFPEERVNAMNVFVFLPKDELQDLQEKATFEIILFYSNGRDEMKISANVFNIK